jgi:hypothetical protein
MSPLSAPDQSPQEYHSPKRRTDFAYSIIRLVADPVRDEAINVGVVVTDDQQARGVMRTNARVLSRIRALQPSYSPRSLQAGLKDLAGALDIDQQVELGETVRGGTSSRLLAYVAGNLSGQLQLTAPQAYPADSVDDAAERLFRRYVAIQPPKSPRDQNLTHAVLKEHIWQVVKRWQEERDEITVEEGSWLVGKHARHPADIVIRNGHPRAAMFALSAHHDDQHLAYYYRDSLPGIAEDMGRDFRIFAVLPVVAQIMDPADHRFARETYEFLREYSDSVQTLELDSLPSVRDQVLALMYPEKLA